MENKNRLIIVSLPFIVVFFSLIAATDACAEIPITGEPGSTIYLSQYGSVITDTLVVQSDAITIDGTGTIISGFSMTGYGEWGKCGIFISGYSDITVTNCTLQECDYSIVGYEIDNCRFIDNVALSNTVGFYLDLCTTSTVSGNILNYNYQTGLFFVGSDSTITDNVANLYSGHDLKGHTI